MTASPAAASWDDVKLIRAVADAARSRAAQHQLRTSSLPPQSLLSTSSRYLLANTGSAPAHTGRHR